VQGARIAEEGAHDNDGHDRATGVEARESQILLVVLDACRQVDTEAVPPTGCGRRAKVDGVPRANGPFIRAPTEPDHLVDEAIAVDVEPLVHAVVRTAAAPDRAVS
jgi:hypothetical protein